MTHSLNDLVVPATIGFATACLLLTSLLQKSPPAPVQAEEREVRPFGMAGSKCRTLSDHSFEIFKDFVPGKVPIQFKNLLLTEEMAERFLKANAKSFKVRRAGSAIVRLDLNWISVNAVNEDRFALTLLPGDLSVLTQDGEEGFWHRWARVRDAVRLDPTSQDGTNEGDGSDDLLMVSVIDGHGGSGPQVADLVARVLHACLAKGLAIEHAKQDVDKVMNDVFVALQEDIIRMPLSLVRDHLPDPTLSPLLPYPAPSLTALWGLVDSGACVSTALVDMRTKKLHVANLGDCRVIGGWFDPKTGLWRCEVMSELGDACANNPVEVAKLRAAHPDDAEVVICDTGRGMRILGNGLPTRAMGDCTHQLSEEDCQALETVFDGEVTKYAVPRKSPPYMITAPDIVTRGLHSASGEQLRFVILATDGLWDKLSSEEACLLAAAYYDKPLQEPIAKMHLPLRYPLVPPAYRMRRPYPAEPLQGTMGVYAEGQWVFQGDDNAATHLLRNAMGRGDDWERQRMLSLTGPMARSYRDDTTVIVVRLDEDGSTLAREA